jgi:hypothetical protein
MAPEPTSDLAMRQCTAANPGIVVNEQCSTVFEETGARWQHRPHSGDWFCEVAMLAPA